MRPEHAGNVSSLLKTEYGIKGDLRVNRLEKEPPPPVVMVEPACGEYIKIKRVRRLVSELKELMV